MSELINSNTENATPEPQRQRRVLIYNTALANTTNTTYMESKAATFGELLVEFKENNIPYTKDAMSVMIGETQHTLELSGAVLPDSDTYTLFMMPAKNTSGASNYPATLRNKAEAVRALKRGFASPDFGEELKELFDGYESIPLSGIREGLSYFIGEHPTSVKVFKMKTIQIRAKRPRPARLAPRKRTATSRTRTPSRLADRKDIAEVVDSVKQNAKNPLTFKEIWLGKYKTLLEQMPKEVNVRDIDRITLLAQGRVTEASIDRISSQAAAFKNELKRLI